MTIKELVNEYDRVSARRNWPVMTEEELLALAEEIPEGSSYTTIECKYNGIPRLIRITKDRGGNIDIHVDATYHWWNTKQQLEDLRNEIGRLIVEDHSLRSKLISED